MTTIKDIAKLCGVSRATVSAVLNSKPGVREKTRNKVLSVIREHGLQNRLIARSLMGHFSQLVAVVVPNLDNPFYTELVGGCTSVLKAHGNHMVCHPTDDSIEDEEGTLEALLGYDLGGYILASVQEEGSYDHVQRVLDSGKPFVAVAPVPGLDTHYVTFEDRRGSKEATDYLVAKGHRNIVCLAARRGVSAKERILGFMESLLDHNLSFDDSMVTRFEPESGAAYRVALEILKRPARPTAMLCFNDMVAIDVYRAAHELHLRIPDDISVVGFDDISMASFLGPPLTTVSTGAHEIGRTAAEILLQAIAGEANDRPIHRTIPTRLVERASVIAL